MSLTIVSNGPPPPDPPPLPCPNCAHPRATVLLCGISCPMCGLSLPTNNQKRYGLTAERWLALGKVRPDAGAASRGDVAPSPRMNTPRPLAGGAGA